MVENTVSIACSLATVLLTYRFLIYVADLNYIMLLFDVGLGWVTSDYVGHGHKI